MDFAYLFFNFYSMIKQYQLESHAQLLNRREIMDSCVNHHKKRAVQYMHQEDRIGRLTHNRVNVLQSKYSFVCIQVPPQLYESYKKLYVGKAHFACTLSV